jgi:hypothetical protein
MCLDKDSPISDTPNFFAITLSLAFNNLLPKLYKIFLCVLEAPLYSNTFVPVASLFLSICSSLCYFVPLVHLISMTIAPLLAQVSQSCCASYRSRASNETPSPQASFCLCLEVREDSHSFITREIGNCLLWKNKNFKKTYIKLISLKWFTFSRADFSSLA